MASSDAQAPAVVAHAADSVFCYECNATREGQQYRPQYNEEGCRLCPECGSDFVEIVAPALAPTPSTASTGVSTSPNSQSLELMAPMDFTSTARLPSGGTARVSVRVIQAPMTMDGLMSSDLPAILAQAGAQGAAVLGVQVNGDGTMSTPVHMNFGNFGDFASSAGLEQLLDQLAQQYQPASDPATRAVVEALPKRLVPPLDKDTPGLDGQDPNEAEGRQQDFAACRPGDPCSVCHSCFEAGETVTQLDCGHCFHGDCILPWLEAHNTCPVCRSQLPRELPGAHHQRSTDSSATETAVAAQVNELLDTVANRLQQEALASARADLGTTRVLPAHDHQATLDSQSGGETAGAATGAPAPAADVAEEPTDAADTGADVPSEGDESEEEEISRGEGQPDNSSGAMGWLGRAAWWVARTAMRRG